MISSIPVIETCVLLQSHLATWFGHEPLVTHLPTFFATKLLDIVPAVYTHVPIPPQLHGHAGSLELFGTHTPVSAAS